MIEMAMRWRHDSCRTGARTNDVPSMPRDRTGTWQRRATLAGLLLAATPVWYGSNISVARAADAGTTPAQTVTADRADALARPVDGQALEEITRRTADLDRREHDLDLRETQVAAAEALARQDITELTTLRASVEKLISQQTNAAEGDMSLLVSLYSNMKPAQAAAVLGKMDPDKAAAILKRLDPHLAGPILAGMDPAAAVKLTEDVQQRHAAFLP
jgi:flagellar motility protein MotE (MotC chaperone)